jgi:hypothetical protein
VPLQPPSGVSLCVIREILAPLAAERQDGGRTTEIARRSRQLDSEREWIAHAREYCSRIDRGSATNVRVFRRSETTPCLVLKRESARAISVFDRVDHQTGLIRTERRFLLPKYALYQDSTTVWTLSVRSIFSNRHTLEVAKDTTWNVRTPFFSTRLEGDAEDGSRVLGRMGQRVSEVRWLIEPDRDSEPFLAALAFMHRQWYRR